MPWILLTLAPVLLVLCLSGYGRALQLALSHQFRQSTPNMLDSAFYGLFVVTAGALVANFAFGLGKNPGPLVIAVGLVLFLILFVFDRRSDLQRQQVLVLALVVPVVCLLAGEITFSSDAGLYHIPAMDWVAHQPVPFGLANLHGRIGFDSAFLLFESSFRSELRLAWSHLSIIEIAVRSLVVAWIADRLLTEAATDDPGAKPLFYAAALVVVLAFLTRFGRTSTDTAANLVAICAWLSFCNLILMKESARSNVASDLSLLLVLVALAITFKVSMLPVAVLVLLIFFFTRWREALSIVLSQYAIALCLMAYLALWLSRNFILTGCMIYPLHVTCIDVPWGVGSESAKHMEAMIRGWARHPDKGHLDYSAIFDLTWLPSWLAKFKNSFELKAVLAAGAFCLASLTVTRRRGLRHRAPEVGQVIWTSVCVAGLGLAFWFLSAPTPRFSWAFFAILSATFLFAGICRFADRPAKIATTPLMVGATLLSLGAALTLPWNHPSFLETPVPPSKEATISGWRFQIPTASAHCWGLFPCAPRKPAIERVEDRSGRFVFIGKRKTRAP